ncbi:MAG: RNA methyltransferase [Oscillospiraceae bacterium]|nr:RNA methyltransferase [Oscillospiraceae bacterium]
MLLKQDGTIIFAEVIMRGITSSDNPNIKLYRKLAASKKHRRESGMFTLEGTRLIADALAENVKLHSVFVTESCLEKIKRGETVIQREALNFPAERSETDVFLIPDGIGEKMSSTDNSQGIFAVCESLDKPTVSDTIKKGGRYILLHRVQDPGNLGTIIRTADAMGVDAVFLAECCDLYNPKTVRSTMGSLFRLNVCETELDEVFPLFAQREVPTFAAVVDGDAVSLTDCDFSHGGVVLIGNEGNGLPREVAEMCGYRTTIKMHGTVNSLNAAMAAGIIMWELVK